MLKVLKDEYDIFMTYSFYQMAQRKKIMYNSYVSRKFAIITIIVLLVLNIGVGYFIFYSARSKADELTNSAKVAAGNASTQNDAKFSLTGSLPKSDVAGEDPIGLRRYKGAVRSVYAKADDGTIKVEYKVLAPVNVVLSYYKTQLAKNNWILSTSATDNIVFTKDTQKATIAAVTAKGVTTYTLTVK